MEKQYSTPGSFPGLFQWYESRVLAHCHLLFYSLQVWGFSPGTHQYFLPQLPLQCLECLGSRVFCKQHPQPDVLIENSTHRRRTVSKEKKKELYWEKKSKPHADTVIRSNNLLYRDKFTDHSLSCALFPGLTTTNILSENLHKRLFTPFIVTSNFFFVQKLSGKTQWDSLVTASSWKGLLLQSSKLLLMRSVQ